MKVRNKDFNTEHIVTRKTKSSFICIKIVVNAHNLLRKKWNVYCDFSE